MGGELLSEIVERMARVQAQMPPVVYPGYIASRIKAAFKLQVHAILIDPERVVASVGDMETLGDCKYRITLTDFNGTKYAVTVQINDGEATNA